MFVRELHGCTAQDAARRLSRRSGLAWLDGECGAEVDARYSFVASDPTDIWKTSLSDRTPFEKLDALAAEAASDPSIEHDCTDDPQLLSRSVPRYIGYLAYDAHFCSHQRRLSRGDDVVASWGRYDACAVFDHERGRAFIAGDDRAACERMAQRLLVQAPTLDAQVGTITATDPVVHAHAIERALEHIARGDIYQVNLARAFRAPFRGDCIALALAMRDASPVPLGFFYADAERCVVARTMERFLRFDAATRSLLTRPIKGTLARHGDDAGEERTLTGDPKERAEHAMIIDLMRNDLSRVAQVGSVRVPQIMQVERYAKLSHLVSTVSCTVRPEVPLSEIVQATFPPGSVTGAPKLRAIELIEELEAVPRGVYTGALGFIDRAGGLSLSVAIRTASVENGQVSYFAGGGIVEASRVEYEVAETELKARVFFDALAALSEQDEKELPQVQAAANVALSAPPFVR